MAAYNTAGCGFIGSMYDVAVARLQQGDNENIKIADDILCQITEQKTFNEDEITIKQEAAHLLWKLWSGNHNPDSQVNPGKAFHYLRYAAEGGLAEAERDLGIAYLNGLLGHSVDLHSAERWLVKASKKGDKKAVDILQNFSNYVGAAKDTQRTNCKGTEAQFFYDCVSTRITTITKQRIEQHVMPTKVVMPGDKELTINKMTLQAHHQFPTAMNMLKAWDLFDNGFKLMILSIDENTIENFFKGAELWAEGRTIESIFENQLFPHKRMNDLVVSAKTHAEKNPENFILQYLHICLKQRTMSNIDFPVSKQISEYEFLAHKVESFPRPLSRLTTVILAGIYYFLGSVYTITDQSQRALYSFEKCYDMDPENQSGSLYGMACNLIDESDTDCNAIENSSTERAKTLLYRFLEAVPKCDRKYAHAHFQLAYAFMLKQEWRKMIYYFEHGVEADDKRLPFLSACNIPIKHILQQFVDMRRSKYCSNPDCQVETQQVKKCTACGLAVYCNKECQKAHWRHHKKVCIVKKK